MPKIQVLLTTLLLTLFTFSSSDIGSAAGQDKSGDLVSQIAPDLAIITEISVGSPFVGQQFSIVYRLRARRPPAAIDIDPQPFAGFWTEMVPVSAETAAGARPLRGGGGVDYLLRQVVAFPLKDGVLQLPPLSLKVKRSGAGANSGSDWDVIGKSSAIDIIAAPLPPGPAPSSNLALVGEVDGKMSAADDGTPEVLLTLQGTANIALFRLQDWIAAAQNANWTSRLLAFENNVRTIDKDGIRRLTLIQRHQWRIQQSEPLAGSRIGDLDLPVFDPIQRSWKICRIPGMRGGRGAVPDAMRSQAPDRSAGPDLLVHSRVWPGMLAALGLTVLAGGMFILYVKFRKQKPTRRSPDKMFSAIEAADRSSPRAFLEMAQKCLEEMIIERGEREGTDADSELIERCRLMILRFRFSIEPLPAGAREEILSVMRQLLLRNGATSVQDAPSQAASHGDSAG